MTDLQNAADVDAAIGARFDEIPDDLVAPAPASEPHSAAAPAEPVAAKTTPDAEPPSADPTSSSPSDPWAQWVAKYGGDEAKAKQAAWEANNRASEYARKAKELEQRLAAIEAEKAQAKPPEPAPPVQETKPAEPPPEIAAYDNKLRAYVSEYRSVDQRIKTESEKFNQTKQQIDRLTRQIASGRLDIDVEGQARQKLAEAYENHDSILAELSKLSSKKEALEDKYEHVEGLKQIALKQQELIQAREAEIKARETEIRQKKDNAVKEDAFRFYRGIDAVAKEGTSIPAELVDDWKEYARAMGVSALPEGDQIEPFLRKTKEKFLALQDKAHVVKSRAYALEKTKDTTLAAPSGKAAVAPVEKRSGFKTKEEVEAAITQRLGA